MACMQSKLSQEEAVEALIVLFEEAGRPFILDVELISPDNDA